MPKPLTKKDKRIGIIAREIAGMADSIRLPMTDKPQKTARKLYATAHKLTGVPQKRLIKDNKAETI